MHKDFKDFLNLLNKHKVKYVIIGGYAVNSYFIPRNTKDLDILVEPSNGNAIKIVKTINDFGFGSMGVSIVDFLNPKSMVQLGHAPIRIDILTSTKGATWETIWKNKIRNYFGNVEVNIIEIDDLIKVKMAVKRKMDLIDADNLKKVRHLFKK
ncbi:MAG: hypothetical protein NUV47_02475 [Patescibacteria group bacterium]|nr:hypothetical protein [Patescibacteria group bacterium]